MEQAPEQGRNLTQVLERVRAGEPDAARELWRLVHGELHGLAARHLRGQRPGHTLQATALLNEAYLRLFGGGEADFQHRRHFFSVASRAMRSILVDHARARGREKRTAPGERVPLDDLVASYEERSADLVALGEALEELEAVDGRLVQLVELRFFGGRSMPEAAELLGLSLRTAEREWHAARAWLQRRLA